MVIEVKLDNNKMERVDVKKENEKFFVSFLDRKDTAPVETNFKECGQFYSVIIENKPFLVKFVENGNIYTVTSSTYTSKIKAENQEKRIRREIRQSFSAKVQFIETRIPGKIMEVMVSPGQEVKKGEDLFILEAMKMENRIFAPRDAKIKEVLVKQGDVIAIGTKLLVFEDALVEKPKVNQVN